MGLETSSNSEHILLQSVRNFPNETERTSLSISDFESLERFFLVMMVVRNKLRVVLWTVQADTRVAVVVFVTMTMVYSCHQS